MAAAASASALIVPPTTALSSRQARRYQQMRDDEEFTDFVVHSNGREFKCHRNVLSASSEYFTGLLRSEMTEALSGKSNLDDIPSAILELLIDHIYQKEVTVPLELLKETMEACHYLGLLEMEDICALKAEEVVDPSNALDWWQLAEKYKYENLKVKCLKCVIFRTSLAEISKSGEFLELSLDDVSSFLEGTTMLKCYSAVDPDDQLEAMMDWIEHNPDDAFDNIYKLMEKIQFANLSLEALETEIKNRAEFFLQYPKVLSALLYSQHLARQVGARKKRNKKGVKDSMVVIYKNDHSLCWTLTESMQLEVLCEIPSVHHCIESIMCKIPGGFAVTGGLAHNGVQLVCKCSMFIVATKSWTPLADIPSVYPDRGHFNASTFIRDRIFLFGLQNVISLKPGEEEWQREANLPIVPSSPEVAWANVNGESRPFLLDADTQELISLDIETNKWSRKAALPFCCSNARMIAVNDDTLLVLGGIGRVKRRRRVQESCFARYSTDTDTWVVGRAPYRWYRTGMMMVNRGQSVYLLGGYDDQVEEYDIKRNTWFTCEWQNECEWPKLGQLRVEQLDK